MLMKLAMYTEKRQERSISLCCNRNNSEFIPIQDNVFGILNNGQNALSYGRDSSTHGANVKNKIFVDVFQCTLSQREKSFFHKSPPTPYEGLILDNQFFLNIITFCNQNGILIKELSYKSSKDTNETVEGKENIEESVAIIRADQDNKIKHIVLYKDRHSILFDKSGYVDILPQDVQFFKSNQSFFSDLIKKGLNG